MNFLSGNAKSAQANTFLLILLVAVLGFAVYYVTLSERETQPSATLPSPLADESRIIIPASDSPWKGTVRAGGSSPLLDFTTADFSKAMAGERLVIAYYYALSCSRCMQEIPELIAAFDALESDKVVGFLMDRQDPGAKDAIAAVARENGIGIDNTKAFFRHGGRVLKAIDPWNKEQYLREIETFMPR